MEPERYVANLNKVAEFFDVRPNTISTWKKSGCVALQGSGPFDLEAVGEWRLHRAKHDKQQKPPADPKTESLQLRKLKADVKLAEQKAELEAFKVAVKTGRLIDSEDVAGVVENQSHAFRQELLAIPKQQCHYFVGLETVEKAEAALRELVFKTLGRLAFIPTGDETT